MKINEKLIPGLKNKIDVYNIITNGEAVKTGRKVDGKDEYVKRINFGNLPNASIKEVTTGLDLSKIIITRVDMIPHSEIGDSNLLPFVSTNALSYQTSIYFRVVGSSANNVIIIDTGGLDRSNYSLCVDISYISKW